MRTESSVSTSRMLAYAIVGAGALLLVAPFFFMFVFATHSRLTSRTFLDIRTCSVDMTAWR